MKLKDYDEIMISDYQKSHNLLRNKKSKIAKLKIELNKLENNLQYNSLNSIIKDIGFMLVTFEMILIACENRKDVKQDFFNLTTFTRASISSTISIYNKLYRLMERNNYFSQGVKERFLLIEKFIEKTKLIRNKVEHGIDPHYSGKFEEVKKTFNIIKQIQFIEKAIKFINILPINDMNCKVKALKLQHVAMSLEERKKTISDLNQKYIIIFMCFTALSNRSYEKLEATKIWIQVNKYKSRKEIKEYIEKSVTSEEEKLMIDLCMKTIELNKAIYFTYENKKKIISNIFNEEIDFYIYFSRLCLIIEYQISDKLGLYLKEKVTVESENTYIKEIVKNINQNNITVDTIGEEICNLINSKEYSMLSKLRNFIEHENGIIEHQAYEEELSSLIILNFKSIVNAVEKIIMMFFNQNKITISDRVQREANSKIYFNKL